jgi:hypothetical protein
MRVLFATPAVATFFVARGFVACGRRQASRKQKVE